MPYPCLHVKNISVIDFEPPIVSSKHRCFAGTDLGECVAKYWRWCLPSGRLSWPLTWGNNDGTEELLWLLREWLHYVVWCTLFELLNWACLCIAVMSFVHVPLFLHPCSYIYVYSLIIRGKGKREECVWEKKERSVAAGAHKRNSCTTSTGVTFYNCCIWSMAERSKFLFRTSLFSAVGRSGARFEALMGFWLQL